MKKLLLILSLSCATFLLTAQQNVGIGTTTPNSNAQLDVVANDKGVLFPRLTTTQRNTLGGSIGNAEEGMLVFDSSIEAFFYWDGSAWNQMGAGAGLWTDQLPTGISHSTGNVGIGISALSRAKLRVYSATTVSGSPDYAGFFTNSNILNTGLKYGIYSEVSSAGNAEKRALYGYAVQNGSSVGPVYGVYGRTSSAGGGNQSTYGVYGQVYTSGNGNQYGLFGQTSSSGTGTRYGVYGVAYGSGTAAIAYGGRFESSGGNSGTKYGVYSRTTGGNAQTSSIWGNYTRVENASSATGTGYGMYSYLQNAGTGSSYGSYSSVSSSGTGTKYAIYGTASGASTQTNPVYGVRGYAYSGGSSTTARAYGVYAYASGTGTGDHYGLYAYNTSTSDNNWAIFTGNGNAYFDDDVRIGHQDDVPGYKLSVNGKVICEELRIELDADWPDYVFASDYDLPTIKEVKAHIDQKKHLPGIPSAAEIEKQGGLDVGDMNKRLLEKVEELTLYIIELNDKVENQHKEIQKLKDSK